MMSRDEQIDHLLNRQAIDDCLTRFCRGMDRFDKALYLSAFFDDAIVAAGPFVGSAEACWDWAQPMHEEGQILTQHALLNRTIEIDGDSAHSECYYLFVARNQDESVMLAGGRYIDRLEQRDGEWRIALRTNQVEWSGMPPAFPPPFSDIADIALNGVSRRDTDDPSYWRPLENRRARTDQD